MNKKYKVCSIVTHVTVWKALSIVTKGVNIEHTLVFTSVEIPAYNDKNVSCLFYSSCSGHSAHSSQH